MVFIMSLKIGRERNKICTPHGGRNWEQLFLQKGKRKKTSLTKALSFSRLEGSFLKIEAASFIKELTEDYTSDRMVSLSCSLNLDFPAQQVSSPSTQHQTCLQAQDTKALCSTGCFHMPEPSPSAGAEQAAQVCKFSRKSNQKIDRSSQGKEDQDASDFNAKGGSSI